MNDRKTKTRPSGLQNEGEAQSKDDFPWTVETQTQWFETDLLQPCKGACAYSRPTGGVLYQELSQLFHIEE